MNDMQLIDYCDKHCKTPKALFAAWRVNRMIELAGSPRGFAPLLKHEFQQMHGSMQILVDLARKRLARPAGGLHIKIGSAYRDVNGEVRQVVDMPPRHRSFDVMWRGAGEATGSMRLADFQEWALEEVRHED
jgi:hypothetical protein